MTDRRRFSIKREKDICIKRQEVESRDNPVIS